jgi:NAD(P)-dependent dehydrogenase (short-subunit alcohol dehydrogenase family)
MTTGTLAVRTHLVSGATSGIGRAIAQGLRKAGERVIPVIRDESQRGLFPDEPEAVIADFEDPAAVDRAFGELATDVDSFINCAGIMISKTLFEAPIEDLARMVHVNLFSAMMAVARVRPRLRPGGAIILLSSQSAFKGSYDDAYAITKGAIHAMVKTLASKLAPAHRIICLAPGVTIGTRMTQDRAADDLEPYRKNIPMQRFATPEEIAGCVQFLLSPAAASMTGCTIDMNGGNVLR